MTQNSPAIIQPIQLHPNLIASLSFCGHDWRMPQREGELIPTRATLLYRLRDLADQSSWNDFFSIYWELIYGRARRHNLSEAECQDVVQETMISVAKKMPNFRYDPEIGSFKGWLLHLTSWKIVEQVRKRGRLVTQFQTEGETPTSVDLIDTFPDPAAQIADEVWDRDWEVALLKAAVDNVKRKLDPARYQIFDCYVNKEWDAETVAKTFQIPVSQVYMARHRIIESIKKEVKRLEKEMT